MKYLTQHINFKSIAENGEISGYASVFNVVDGYGDVVLNGAFKHTVASFAKGKKPKLLWQHDARSPIGIIEEIFEDNYGLFIKGRLLLEIPKAKEAYSLLKNKAIDGFSIGYKIRNNYFKNNKQYLTDVDLLEISIVTFPVCEAATVEDVKSENNSCKEISMNHEEIISSNNGANQFTHINKEINTMKNEKIIPLSENTSGDAYIKSDFSEYIRKGIDDFLKKSLSDKDGSCGGCFIPQEVDLRIHDRLKLLSPMRTISRVMTISSNSVELLVDSQMPDAGWVSRQDDEREETDSPEVKKIKIPVHEIYAKPMVSQKLLDDSQIDVEEWLVAKIAEKIAFLENDAFINGVGNEKPLGFLKVDSEDKEKREFGKLQHFYSGAIGKFSDNNTAIDILVDMIYSLKPIYIKNAKWIMSRSALAEMRKLKNKDGAYLWQPSLSEASPSTLLGYPVIVDDNMPTLAEGTESTSIAFGDFRSGYQIVDRQGLKILRDPYTSKPFVEFYATKRTGGGVVDFEAIKLLKFKEKAE
ncbi:MAG: phage major capsid protein [Holosporaceae bacterium]|jgi:HK97 family phage major capsid protein/HK97 family phage prohead protease|nr:phage major capsid protein [Holosporaceae bacterium]